MSLLRRGIERLADGLRAQGVEITYLRGAASATLRAMPGRSEHELEQAGGALLQVASDDWLIAAADLVLDGQATAPAAGDQLRYASGGLVYVYEVPRAAGGMAPWRWSDGLRLIYRVHTRLRDTESG